MKRGFSLRTLLVPFALTVLVGGGVLVVVFSFVGLLPFNLGGLALPTRTSNSVPQLASANPLPRSDPPDARYASVPDPPATSLPADEDFTLVCESNARSFALVHPDATPVTTALRLSLPPGDAYAYVIADGRLLRVSLDALDQPDNLLFALQTEPLNRVAGGFPMQELVDLAYDTSLDTLLLLDKSGRVFGYRPGGQWSFVHQAELAPDDQADPSYLSLSASGGTVFLLDADLNQVWRVPGESAPEALAEGIYSAFGGPQLSSAVDMVVHDDALFVLDADGGLRRYALGERRASLDIVGDAALPLGLQVEDERLMVVDALRRTVTVYDAQSGMPLEGFIFAHAQTGLLRDAGYDAEGRLLALVGNDLVMFQPDDGSGGCNLPPEANPTLDYYGVDLSVALTGFRYPIDDGQLPGVPRAYPGARRLYRAGIHHGFDVHPWDVPGGIDIGEPVLAMQDGVVRRADVDYRPIGNAEFNFLTEQAQALGVSLPGTLDRIGGRQVWIDHANGVSTRYLHLDSIAEGIEIASAVKRGQPIGTVGVSGTGREADEVYVVAHLHAEIWIGDNYLGQGLTLRETMWLWQQLFPTVAVTTP